MRRPHWSRLHSPNSAVIAVALAGSGVAGTADEQSDLDLYVYAEEPVAMVDQIAIATRFATRREVGNSF